MNSKVVAFILEMLLARSAFEYVWKILFWCALTTAIALLTELILGTEISSPIDTYFSVVLLISAPLFSIGMLVTRHLKKLQDDLAHMASTDLLTGLNNRRAFFSQISDSEDGNMVLLDIDHFKSINDTYGHAAGDEVLVVIAQHMKTHVGDLGLLARIGGEEFAIFSAVENEPEFLDVIRKLICGVDVDVADMGLTVTLSAGLARAERELDLSDLMRRADEALYDAKSAGRACLRRWNAQNRPDALRKHA